MKECSFCGMPLRGDAETDLCDFCQNDDGKEMLAPAPNEPDPEEQAGAGWTNVAE